MTSRFANRGFSVVALSGELSQNERTHALQSLRDGRVRVCIATDVAARGLDLPNLELVIHADLPKNRESLLHRSGRTGRAGRKGVCALIVPHNARRRTERLLQTANVKAEWAKPPSADDILRRDRERILEDPVLSEPLTEDEQLFAQELLAHHSAEQIAAAFLRLSQAGQSAPEELLDAAPPEREPKKRRDNFKGGIWFSLSVGHKQNAEPRWLVPMLCRAGHITKNEIGAIKIRNTDSHVELAPGCVDRFLAALGPGRKVEDNITMTPLDGAPPEEPREKPDKKPYEKKKSTQSSRKPATRADEDASRETARKKSKPKSKSKGKKSHTLKIAGKMAAKPGSNPGKPRKKNRISDIPGFGPGKPKKPRKPL
jgi:ATP-dependent RNA helicase DeaD